LQRFVGYLLALLDPNTAGLDPSRKYFRKKADYELIKRACQRIPMRVLRYFRLRNFGFFTTKQLAELRIGRKE
jgi:hypothetical protein